MSIIFIKLVLASHFIVMGKKQKKPESTRVPRTRNAGTQTESQFWGGIRAALREKSRYWKPISNVRRKARRAYHGPLKRRKWEYQCNICKQYFDINQTEVDHIIPAGRLACADDLPGFVERLFIEEDGLQLVCKGCHEKKTKAERL
ncbi:MAG: HNH endonuclease [Tissierellales bacterium]|nr:HNH endonuclease [Tissierellales bacterium]